MKMNLSIVNIETGESISKDIFHKSCAFKNPIFRPQVGEIIESDSGECYELVRSKWLAEEKKSSAHIIMYMKQVSSEIKKDVLLVHHVPFTSEPSRNLEYFVHYQDYIKRELPYIKHIFVSDKESGKLTIECIQPSDVPQELLEKCIALQKQYLESGKL